MYHRVRRTNRWDQLSVAPDHFDYQMQRLMEVADVVDLGEALVVKPRSSERRLRVAITFDDGYLDTLTNAVPTLRRLGLPATIFVTTRFADQESVHARYAGEPGRLHMDWDEVRSVADLPGMSIGSHTISHPLLTSLPDSECHREIAESRTILSERLGIATKHFCYPSGDRTAREREYALQAGYETAATVSPGRNRPGVDPWLLRRTEVTDRDFGFEFDCKLWGALDLPHRILDFARLRRSVSRRARSIEGR